MVSAANSTLCSSIWTSNLPSAHAIGDSSTTAESPGPSSSTPAQQAREVIAICNALDRDKTSIFGNSRGGIIALQFAVSYPECLDRVMSTRRRRLYYSTMPRTISTEHLCSSASIGHSVVKAAFQRISHRDQGIRRQSTTFNAVIRRRQKLLGERIHAVHHPLPRQEDH
jgi:pimeloyl-ACP methyl ester carboxylesterase